MLELWRGMRPLIGTVVGVGIFALPYVFAQAGFVIASIELVAIAALSLLTFFLYGELLFVHKNHAHFVGVVSHELGFWGKFFATVSYFGTLWGAMLAYIVIGGEFAGNMFGQYIGWSTTTWQILFFALASLAIFGGVLVVRKVQAVLIPLFILLVCVLVSIATPAADYAHFATFDITKAGLPLGVLIFAFSGFGALPEVRDVLGSKSKKFYTALTGATLLTAVIYLLFAAAVVGLTGRATSPEAVEGLRFALGGAPFVLVSIIGLCTVFTAFVTVGQSLQNTLLYDFRLRLLSAWAIVIGLPLLLYGLGARNFVEIIGTTGGILGGIGGIVLVIAYERARLSVHVAKRSLTFSPLISGLLFLVFVSMIVITIFELLA